MDELTKRQIRQSGEGRLGLKSRGKAQKGLHRSQKRPTKNGEKDMNQFSSADL
jgi:hypothetical protein